MLPNVTISGPYLSDAFFNSKLIAYDVAWKLNGDTKAALLDDATDFVCELGIADQIRPEMLVEDFLKRL
jgi:hypothetical protein